MVNEYFDRPVVYDSNLKPANRKVIDYYPKSKIKKRQFTFVDGKIQGWYESWYEDGMMKTMAFLEKGKMKIHHRWNMDGTLNKNQTFCSSD